MPNGSAANSQLKSSQPAGQSSGGRPALRTRPLYVQQLAEGALQPRLLQYAVRNGVGCTQKQSGVGLCATECARPPSKAECQPLPQTASVQRTRAVGQRGQLS